MTPTKLIAVVLTCLFATAAFAADAAPAPAPTKEPATKEIAAAKETPKAEAKPKATAKPAPTKGISSHLGDTRIDLRHCLKEDSNMEIHRCTL